MRASLALLTLLSALALASGASLNMRTQEDADPERFLSIHQEAQPAKMAWPELVGVPGEQAKAALQAELPGARILLVPVHSMMTMDFSLDRVRIIISRDTGRVATIPRRG